MKEMKRIISLVLCFVMVVGLIPMSVFAADSGTVIDAAIFCSDVHGSTSSVSSVFSAIKNADSTFDPSTAAFVGDTQTAESSVTSVAQDVFSGMACYYAFGSHDDEGGATIEDVTGVLYNGTNYAIYAISQSDMESYSNAQSASADFASDIAEVDASKPLFVISHMPLHARRADNDGAGFWCDAINTAAASRDIVFFWAHNHTGENSTDTAAYYLAKGSGITVEDDSSDNGNSSATSNKTLAFTYMNAGYIGKSAGRGGVATTVKIYADRMVFKDYNSSGAYTGSYAHNVEVTREFASTTTEPEVTEPEETTAPTEAAYITSIAVTTQPTKLTYDVGEELDTTGMVVTATYSDGTTAEVTNWYQFGNVDMTTAGAKEVTIAYSDNGTVFKTTFTITVEEQVAETATLTGLEITTDPAKTEYLLSEALDITGMVVEATFSDGTVKTLSYGGFASEAATAADLYYNIESFNMYVAKEQEVVVTFTYGDVTLTDIFTINVWAEDFSDETTGVKVHVSGDYGVTKATVAESTNANVASAIAEVISGDNYVAYDISLTFDEGYATTKATKTVTLPIPAGVTNPVVYYVSDDGATVTNMNATKGDGVVTFETTHFSTYVVGESTEITVPDPTTQTVTGATTTEEKEVYVLVSTPTANNQYIIVSGNSAGSAYALKENTTTGTSITINAAGNGISAPYIETSDETIMWNAASGMTFRSENGSYYLRQSSSGGSRSLSFSTSQSTNWAVETNTLSYQGKRSTYYVSGGSTWSLSSSPANVYFYEKQTVTVTTSANGTYSIAGTPAEVTKVVVEGTTTTLGSTLTFVPESGTTTTTDTSTTATYTVVENGDPNGIISGISGNTVTFTGNYGKALVKVSYTMTVNGTDYTVDNYITVIATAPVYDIEISQDGTTAANDIIAVRGVTENQTLELSYILTYEDADGVQTLTPDSGITWYCYLEDGSDASAIASIDQTGKLTFTGAEGTIKVMVAYETSAGTSVNDIITINVRKSNAVTPGESTTDFPRWPNEGAVRFDKTASAVGNFSETGIAQIELSMAGIPVKTGGAVDVVIMLDMTGSMSTTAMAAAEESAIAFAEQIVKNDDGTFNDSRIAVLAFNSGDNSPYTYWALGTITADQWDGFCTAVRGASDDQESGGTPYDEALKECQEILAAAKTDGTGNDRQQFCVFVSDGGPTSYEYITNYDEVKAGTASTYTTSTASATGGSNQSDSNFATIATYTHEYYSTLMKDSGVTMYSVLTGLSAEDYPNCTTILQNIASDSSKAYVVEDVEDTSAITNAFTAIAEEINAAATNVNVEDVITDEYDLIFELPNSNIEGLPEGQEFYIEVVDYPLDEATHERTGESKILQRIYLATGTDGNVYISKITYTDDSGNVVEQAITPVYTAKAKDTDKAYFDADGNYYPDGNGTHNMTSGAYVVLNDDGSLKSLHTANFTYVVATKQLNWTVTSMSQTSEVALRYFVYLKDSGGVAAADQIDAGTYPTNKYATLTYTNHLGTECEQTFPVPQMTWNGAQVSYVFYLVNENGVPVNRAGREVTFAEAIFVTDIYTYAIVWNDLEQAAGLEASYLASDKLPSDYKLYDQNALYKIHVYEDEEGVNLNNHFIIGGTSGDTTTYVYNNKTDVTKYNEHGTYAASSTYLCKSYSVTATVENGVITAATYTAVSGETQVLASAMESTTGAAIIGGYAYYIDENGEVYTIVQKTDATAISGFDFANTTVAFAVVWEKQLVEDTVVVDFGLPVDIDVVSNDFVYNYITGIGATDPNYGINTGYKTEDSGYTPMSATELTVDGHSVSVHDQNHIRFTPGTMEFNEPVEFYYETTVEVYENSQVVPSYMYSKVTVIPATTVYYEDNFVTYEVYKESDNTMVWDSTNGYVAGVTEGTTWSVDGTTISATQAQDRPGASQISAKLDADNNYGYDDAYKTITTYSMGSAHMINVDSNYYGKAKFSFYGTGFDVISLTSSQTGTIVVQVMQGDTVVKSKVVDTYYGYTLVDGKWVISENNPNALYQVPVITVEGLTYGKYDVVITAAYNKFFAHNDATGYDLYLDAIRVYDPTGVVSGEKTNETVSNAYAADGEGWPVYEELRNNIIEATTFGTVGTETDEETNQTTNVSGLVFIDSVDDNYSISDYTGYGPNNELYLANNQAIAFNATMLGTEADIQLGVKVANGNSVTYTINGDEYTVNSTTDMYYSILDYVKSGTVVIKNVSGGILSLTNIKFTYTQNPYGAVSTSLLWMDEESADWAVAGLNYIEPDVEETIPEESEPESSEPEVEENVPETTAPEETTPENTEPEVTEPEEGITENEVAETITNVINKISNFVSSLLSKWFH